MKKIKEVNNTNTSLNEEVSTNSDFNSDEIMSESLKQIGTQITELEEDAKKDEKTKKSLKGRVRRRNILIVVLLIIIIILLLKSCGNPDYAINLIPELENSEFFERVDEVREIEMIDVPVSVSTNLTEVNPYYTLSNPETNKDKFYLVYEFYVRGKTDEEPIYKSKYVEAGKLFSADLYEALDGVKGTHYLTVHVKAFDVQTLEEKNGIVNDIEITIY